MQQSHDRHFGKSRLVHYLPILGWLRDYNKGWLRADLMAGMTLAAFTIPEAMAYAGLAGLPPQAGLYASIAAPLLYMLFGTSRQLAVGPTSAVSVLVASGLGALMAQSPEQYAAMASMAALSIGAFAIVAYLLKLGFLVNFISESVLVGFTAGAGLYIASTQLGKLLGISGAQGEFIERLQFIVLHLGETNPWSLGIGSAGIIVMLVGEHRLPRLPWAMILVLGSIGVMHMTNLADQGVHMTGKIPSGLPAFTFPCVSLSCMRSVLPIAFAAFVLSYIEGMSMARSFASKHKYRIDANQELLALGVASMGAGLTQAYPVAGSFSRTVLNDESGAKTPLASGVAAVSVTIVVVFLAGLFTKLPEPILASVVLMAVRGLFKVRAMRRLYRLRREEFWTAMAVLVGVLVLGILDGILVGVVLSLLLVIGRASQARMSFLGRVPGRLQFADIRENPENITIPGLHIIRFDEGIFYANAESLRNQVLGEVRNSNPPAHGVVLDLEMTSDLDVPGAEMLLELHEELQSLGVHLRLSRLQPSARALLDRSGITEKIGEYNIHLRTMGAAAAHLNDEGTHLQEAYDILPDMVRRMQDTIIARAEHVSGEDRSRLKAINGRLEEILEILKFRSD